MKRRPPARHRHRLQGAVIGLLAGALCLLLGDCRPRTHIEPSIEITRVPPAGPGGPDALYRIAGRVHRAQPGQRIVLFAHAGPWWVQPLVDRPFTTIEADSTWANTTHSGSSYAAILVDSRYHPLTTMNALPQKGGPVLAVATVEGRPPHLASLQFSGYQWEIRESEGETSGTPNVYQAANAWTDQSGFLHLRIAGQTGRWTSAQVKLPRNLGYGSYRWVVRDVAHLEPAAVFVCGPLGKMDLEISRWGEPESKNAQYVVQPYVVPANTVRFFMPGGKLTDSMDWEPGRVTFRTVHTAPSKGKPQSVAEHAFTSGISSPSGEKFQMRLYVFDNKREPLQHEAEVVIEKFEFRP